MIAVFKVLCLIALSLLLTGLGWMLAAHLGWVTSNLLIKDLTGVGALLLIGCVLVLMPRSRWGKWLTGAATTATLTFVAAETGVGTQWLRAQMADEWQNIEAPRLAGLSTRGHALTDSYAQRLDREGRRYEAFAAYISEIGWHLDLRQYAQTRVLAPKLHALAAKLEPPPVTPAVLEANFEHARCSLADARSKEDLDAAARDFTTCVRTAPWIPETWYYLSVAAQAADDLRAAEAHLAAFLQMKPEAMENAAVRKRQSTLQQHAPTMTAWENSLGMRFVPLHGSSVMFSVWETREKDYSQFVKETNRPWDKNGGININGWTPATVLNLYDAGAFCEWLTRKERQEGIIGPHDYYRLPSHDEWQAAAGGNYPWGDSWPPPPGAGNLSGGEIRERYEKLRDAGLVTAQTMIEDGSGIEGYEDGFATLAPVGSFEPNALGMHDLAGNVQEWCAGSMADLAMPLFTSEEKSAVGLARGGSFFTADANTAATSHRKPLPAFEALYEDTGFRCVLAREFTLLSLHETADSPIEDSIEINGPWTDKPVHGRRHPVVMASNLVSLAVSTRWRPKMEIGFESEDERLRDPAGWRKERRLLIMIGGDAVCLFRVAEDGFLVENATRTIKITFASLDDLNRVKALLEPRLKPRY